MCMCIAAFYRKQVLATTVNPWNKDLDKFRQI